MVAHKRLKTLTRVFTEHEGYISDKWEHYLGVYETVLARFVLSGRPIRLLEVGVQNGGSLQIWSKYLPEGSTIVGVDIDPTCDTLTLSSNVSIVIGNAADPTVLDRLLANAEFDIIIDDGSHRSEQVIATFRACFSRLKPGGLYIVEDMHASYFSSHDGGFRLAGASMEWFKDLTDALNVDHFEKDAVEKVSRAELDWLQSLGAQIARITFFDSMILIDKLSSEKRVPYRRVMTGRDARVVDCAAQIIPNLPDGELRTLVLPPSTAASFAPALLNAIATTREEIGGLRFSLNQANYEREITVASAAAATARAERAEADAAEATSRAERAEADAAEATARAERAEADAAEAASQSARFEARARTAETAHRRATAAKSESEARAALFQQKADIAHARAEQAREQLVGVTRERDAVLQSTTWKAAWPFRCAVRHLPPSAVRILRGGVKVIWWSATLQLRRKLRERRRRPNSDTDSSDHGNTTLPASHAEAHAVPLGGDVTVGNASALLQFFDPKWYEERYGDVPENGLKPFEHFLQRNGQELRDPNSSFDTAWYLEVYPDVRRAGHMALEHFVIWGAAEGRRPFRDFDYEFYREIAGLEGASNLEAYHHYLTHGQKLGILTRKRRSPVAIPFRDVTKGSRSVSTHATNIAPHQSNSRLRILFIEDHLPTPSLGAGFGRSEVIIRALLDFADLDIFVRSRRDEDEMLYSHFDAIDIAYGPDPALLELYLSSRPYDFIYVCRSHNLANYEQVLRTWKQGGGCIVFDTEAISAVRDVAFAERVESYAAITGSARFARLVEEELRPAEIADAIIAVNELEGAILRRRLSRPVMILGHFLSVRPLGRPITDRSGLLFVGALHDTGTPNYDSLVWFLDHVWPRIRAERPEEVLRIAGYVHGGVPLEPLQRNGVSCLGPISDLTAEFGRARVFIAPTRFAAGIPVKVCEAFSYGLPVVGSRLIGEQVTDDIEGFGGLIPATVMDDGEEFAKACLELLKNRKMWFEKHDAALAYVKSLCAPSRLQRAIDTLVSDVRKRTFTTINHGMDDLPACGRRRSIDLNQWRDEITF